MLFSLAPHSCKVKYSTASSVVEALGDSQPRKALLMHSAPPHPPPILSTLPYFRDAQRIIVDEDGIIPLLDSLSIRYNPPL